MFSSKSVQIVFCFSRDVTVLGKELGMVALSVQAVVLWARRGGVRRVGLDAAMTWLTEHRIVPCKCQDGQLREREDITDSSMQLFSL